MRRFSPREHASSILVAALSSTFGVALLLVTGELALIMQNNALLGSSHTVNAVLSFIALVFVAIAIYTGAVVTSNTFATIIAGRTRTIALLRLIGSSARDQRRAVAREGLLVGVIGALIGLVVGVIVNIILINLGIAFIGVPRLDFAYIEPLDALPVVAVILTTWLASWVGSRRVLVVSPIEATGAAKERTLDEAGDHRGRNIFAGLLFVGGSVALFGSALLGEQTPYALILGVFAGVVSFTGVVLGAGVIMPPALRFVGALLGGSAAARLAARNSVRYPERSARMTVGLVIGVTLVTLFAVALQTTLAIIDAAKAAQPDTYAGTDQIISIVATIFGVIGGFSAVIAAVGLVNNLSLSVLQRTREIGLLRALGFTARQVRAMITAESVQLTVAAVIVGLILGTFYGWAGAASMLGGISGGRGLVLPAIPPLLIVGLVVAALLLTWIASLAPTRRATRLVPVEALAVE
jgi:putative ABC transport system permease protein